MKAVDELRAWNGKLRYFGICVLWYCCLPLMPLLVFQARGLRKRIPKLETASGPTRSQGEVSKSSLKLAIIGESTAVGVGANSLNNALPGGLVRALRRKFRASIAWRLYGQDGATIQKVLLTKVPTMSSPMDVAIIVLGVNDVFRLTSSRRWRHCVEQLSVQLRNLGCRQIIYSQVPPIGKFPALPWLLRKVLSLRVRILNDGLRCWAYRCWRYRLVAYQNVDVCYAGIDFSSEQVLMARDGVHPSEQGYMEWARQLAEYVDYPALT